MLSFFIYDSLKIAVLLLTIIFIVALLRSYLPAEKIKKILTRKLKFVGNILAALFGIITPFCSCSAIPLFVGLVESGVPLGVTFSYLVSAPWSMKWPPSCFWDYSAGKSPCSIFFPA